MPSLVTPPAPRLHYSQDGTLVIGHNVTASVSYTLTQANKDVIDDEDTADTWSFSSLAYTANGSHVKYLTFVFPELRNISGVFAYGANLNGSPQTVQSSTDTTTGLDGTWGDVLTTSGWILNSSTPILHRTSITALSLTNVKGLRIRSSDSGSYTFFYEVHLYGTKVSNTGLSFRHPTLDQALAVGDMDFGDVALGQTYTRTFRVKNNHATQTANGVIVSAVDVSTSAAWTMSIGGGSYQSSLDIGNLAAGATSGVITARRIVGGGETVQTAKHGRLQAIPTSWS